MPGDWKEGREYSAAESTLAVGDLVVIPRSDGTMRFGEVLTVESRSCMVCVYNLLQLCVSCP